MTYSADLGDCPASPVAAALTKRLAERLAPNGMLLIPNSACGFPESGYMEAHSLELDLPERGGGFGICSPGGADRNHERVFGWLQGGDSWSSALGG